MHPHLTARAGLLALLALSAGAGCRGCREDELEEEEELDRARDHYWRFELAIVGQGQVVQGDVVDCARDDAGQRGACGPRLVLFKELSPPLLDAKPMPGWRFEHWGSRIRGVDGAARSRVGPMPDSHYYIDGFGYSDTGETETVTAFFAPAVDGGP